MVSWYMHGWRSIPHVVARTRELWNVLPCHLAWRMKKGISFTTRVILIRLNLHYKRVLCCVKGHFVRLCGFHVWDGGTWGGQWYCGIHSNPFLLKTIKPMVRGGGEELENV